MTRNFPTIITRERRNEEGNALSSKIVRFDKPSQKDAVVS